MIDIFEGKIKRLRLRERNKNKIESENFIKRAMMTQIEKDKMTRFK